jgi:hypothetical protein
MHLFKDGTAVEDIKLYDFKTKPEMHELFQKKGLQKKSQAVIFKERRIRKAEKDLSSMEGVQPVYATMTHIYMVIGVGAVVFAFLIDRRSKNKKRKGAAMARSNNIAAVQKV